MWTVYKHKGAIVENLGNRNGIGYCAIGTDKRGGARTKGEYKWNGWVEPAANQAILEIQSGITSNNFSTDESDNDSLSD